MKRMSFNELEALCAVQGCRFNDLFLIGERVFVMIEAENWRSPTKYRPLLVDDPAVLEVLPEILRKLDATEFPSMEVFTQRVHYESALWSEFETLKYQLYDLLEAHTGKAPEGDDLCLDLEAAGDAELYLTCDDASVIGADLIAKIEALLLNETRQLDWSVKVLEGPECRHVFSVKQKGLVRAS